MRLSWPRTCRILTGGALIGPTEFAVLSAASYRGVQLLVWDSLTQPIRDKVEIRHATKPGNKIWWFLNAVLGCVYCCGMYVAGIALLAYLLASGTWGDTSWLVHGIEWFAVAGVAALLNRRDDTWGTS